MREPGRLVVFDIGNTHIVVGIFQGEELVDRYRLVTDAHRTSEEYMALLLPLLGRHGIDPGQVSGVAVSSVVPPLKPVFDRLGRDLFGRRPLFVGPGVKTGLAIRSDNPAEVGADRIVNAVAARELYGAPSIVVDFGTALTFDVVDADGSYIGGAIAPGLTIAAEALFAHASRLFRVDLEPPPAVIGTNTSAAMQSGLYYGFVGLVDGILARIVEALGEPKAVIATGGQARLLSDASRFIDQVDPDLTLCGLRLIHDLN
ncbi:MAG: type III pantothenate kinase [Thermoanaerobaculia bacterium]|nr:type III pantothenate kinase [Thermoanaerobaculia bacterium]